MDEKRLNKWCNEFKSLQYQYEPDDFELRKVMKAIKLMTDGDAKGIIQSELELRNPSIVFILKRCNDIELKLSNQLILFLSSICNEINELKMYIYFLKYMSVIFKVIDVIELYHFASVFNKGIISTTSLLHLWKLQNYKSDYFLVDNIDLIKSLTKNKK